MEGSRQVPRGLWSVNEAAGTRPAEPSRAEDERGDDTQGVSVVLSTHTELRWPRTRAALESVTAQRPGPPQVLLVVDHNVDWAARASRELDGVSALESDSAPGLSGRRNAGLRAATQRITAFLDDDAEARPWRLASLTEPYSDSDIVATEGRVHRWWPTLRPPWLPPASDWVVGCSYLGLPDSVTSVRDPIGANISPRTGPALQVGGFDASLGRSASGPRGCEETEMAIRLIASRPKSVVLYMPAAAVDHHIGNERLRYSYFLRGCRHEGPSKAAVTRLVDSGTFMRMTATVAGLAAAAAGYLIGRAAQAGSIRIRRHTIYRQVSGHPEC